MSSVTVILVRNGFSVMLPHVYHVCLLAALLHDLCIWGLMVCLVGDKGVARWRGDTTSLGSKHGPRGEQALGTALLGLHAVFVQQRDTAAASCVSNHASFCAGEHQGRNGNGSNYGGVLNIVLVLNHPSLMWVASASYKSSWLLVPGSHFKAWYLGDLGSCNSGCLESSYVLLLANGFPHPPVVALFPSGSFCSSLFRVGVLLP